MAIDVLRARTTYIEAQGEEFIELLSQRMVL